MAKCLATLLLFVALVAGQTSTASFAPSNDTLPSNMTNPDIELSLTSGTNALLVRNTYNIAPLTAQAGIGQSETAVNVRNAFLITLYMYNARQTTNIVWHSKSTSTERLSMQMRQMRVIYPSTI